MGVKGLSTNNNLHLQTQTPRNMQTPHRSGSGKFILHMGEGTLSQNVGMVSVSHALTQRSLRGKGL